MTQLWHTYFEFFLGLLELQHKLLIVLQEVELRFQWCALECLQQSGALASLLHQLRVSLQFQQPQLLRQSAVFGSDALQDMGEK